MESTHSLTHSHICSFIQSTNLYLLVACNAPYALLSSSRAKRRYDLEPQNVWSVPTGKVHLKKIISLIHHDFQENQIN